jgi:sugar phosphate isomerase/epimerase
VSDDHLPVGEGIIDYTPLFNRLRELAETPSITLEAHDPEELQRSLANFTTLATKELTT